MAATPLNAIWLILATLLVLSMQAGFLLLEAGRVRSKNSISVAQKNVADFAVAWVAFFLFGYVLMFGEVAPWAHAAPGASADDGNARLLGFLYQLGFCAAAASIVSGGIAERMAYRAYLVLAFVTAALLYPIVGRWVWSSTEGAVSGAWLASLGFVDFAGASVVHGVGAWVALAAILTIGPRLGRFDDDGRVLPLSGHNSVIALLGALVLLLGWFGFNAGAIAPDDPAFSVALVNTGACAAFGAFAGMWIGARLDAGIFNPSRITSGLLGGLVASTAAVNAMQPTAAIVLGILGGALATWGGQWLLERWRLDDPLEVVATHGLPGVLGTLAVAFVLPADQLPAGSRLAQLGVQSLGVVTIFAFSFGGAWLALRAIGRFTALRVTPDQERLGLNHTEHGEALGAQRLQQALQARIQASGAVGGHIDVEAGDESSELAHAMNRLLDRHEEARQAIQDSAVRFQHFAQTASDWLWETDARLRLTFVSAHGNPQDGRSALSALLGSRLDEAVRLRNNARLLVREALRSRQGFPFVEAQLRMPDGTSRLIEIRGVPFHDPQGGFLGYRGTFNDVTERRHAERRAAYLARHDELTGLSNRRALAEDAKTLMAELSENSAMIVAAVDLDGFKAVNDGYGHPTGDELLRAVAKRLNESIRTTDRVYRTGGDEFVLTLGGFVADRVLDDGLAWCNRLVETLSAPYAINGNDLELGASIGIAVGPMHSNDPERLAEQADLALYAAKTQGKGRAIAFDDTMDAAAREQARLERDLRQALAREEFLLEYQPQYASNGTSLVGFEALIRWDHPELGRLSPALFIPVAERLQLMGEIGAFALNTACEFAASWSDDPASPAPCIAVNVSPSQFRQGQIVGDVRRALARTGLAPERLELEITEELLIEDFAGVRRILIELRELGVSVAIDDFGSGQASLQYLNQFPITKLKIDRSFVRGLANDSRAQEITQSIVTLGHKLGCQVVAEGVEENAQSVLLTEWACDQMQGFMYARPMPAADVLTLLASRHLDASVPAHSGGKDAVRNAAEEPLADRVGPA